MPEISLPKAVVKNSDQLPVSLTRFMVEDFSLKTGNQIQEILDEEFPITLEKQTASIFGDLERKYKNHKQNAFVSRTILETNNEMVKSIVGLASVSAATTGVGISVAIGVNYFMDKLLDESLNEFDRNIERTSRKLIGLHLSKIRDQTGKSMEEIVGMSPNEAKSFLFESDSGLMDNSIDFFQTPDEKIDAVHKMSQILEDRLTSVIASNKKALEFNAMIDEAQSADIEDIKKQVKFISKYQQAQSQTINAIDSKVDILHGGLVSLSKNVENLFKKVDKNKEHIGIIKNYIFSNADVSSKLDLLRSGLLDDSLLPDQKAHVEDQLSALEAKKELENDINDFLDKTQHISNIMQNVGLFDEKTAQKANELINIGATAMNAFAAYSSGNVLGAVSSISNLFGGGSKSDPAAARHEQIMKKLGIIDKKIDDVLQNQRKLFEGQIQILKSLQSISNQINELHGLEMEAISDLKTATLYNRLSNVRLHSRDFEDLKSISVPFEKEKAKGKINSYADLQLFFTRGTNFRKNSEILESFLNVYTDYFDEFILLKNYEYQGENEDLINDISVLNKGYRSIINYIEYYGLISDLGDYSEIATSDLYILDKKEDIKKSAPYVDNKSWRLLRSGLVSTHKLAEIFNVLEQIHIFFPLVTSTPIGDRLHSLKDLFNNNQLPSTEGKKYFEHFLELVNYTIIQENLLSGDFLLPHFYEVLFGESKLLEEVEQYQAIIGVLNSNRLLKFNFSNYFVKRQLEKIRLVPRGNKKDEVQFDFFEYALYLNDTSSNATSNQANPTNLRYCFDEELRPSIIYHGNEHKRWKLDLYRDDRDAYLELPTSEEFSDGIIRYRREMYELMDLKSKIIDQISDYELGNFLPENRNLYQHLKFN